jgi:hypothetical protein
MTGGRAFAEAVRNGERNREAARLMSNWCANARIEGMGRGLLAAQTGLPIGHHAIGCDFATDDSRAYFYELRDAAVDFHDRNCRTCPHRKGGRLPNITELAAARDRRREVQAKIEAERTVDSEAAFAHREVQRAELKTRLSPIGQALVDDIAAYDREASQENRDRLLQSARLAPEHFEPALIEYVLHLGGTADWFDEPALGILRAVDTESWRLARVAVRVLGRGVCRDLAAEILAPLVHLIDHETALAVTPAAMDLALPDQRDHIGARYREPQPELLARLHELHPGAVAAAVDRLLASRKSYSVELAGRGLTALIQSDPEAATPHARSLISTFARATLLVDDFDDLNHELYHLADAVVGAFDDAPEAVDGLLQDYATGPGSEARNRVYELYSRALRSRDREMLPADSQRVRIAFRRMIWVTTEPGDDKTLQAAASVFRHTGGSLDDIARVEIDALLSAPFLLADRIDSLESRQLDQNDPLAAIERGSQRASLQGLIVGFLELAARAAGNDEAALAKIGDFLDAIPEDRHLLRGLAISSLGRLADTLAGLQRYLPHLYRATVGPSVIERSYAATAFSKLSPNALENVPPLLFEAFQPLLWDSYTAVHKAAARAFRRSLPDALLPNALNALLNLVHHYRTESGEDRFLAQCVRTLAGFADEFGQHSGALRRYLIGVALEIDPVLLRSDLRSLSHTLGLEPGFARLVIRMLPHMGSRINQSDGAAQLVGRLSTASIRAHEAELERLGCDLAPHDPWLTLVVTDALARAGAGAAAARVASARLRSLDDIPRNRNQRIHARFVELALAFEQAVAARDDAAVQQLVTAWKDNEAAMASQHREERRASDNRTNLPFAD